MTATWAGSSAWLCDRTFFIAQACRRDMSQLKVVRTALKRLMTGLPGDDFLPGPCLPDDTRERIKRSLKSD